MKYKLLALVACAAWPGCSSDVMVLTALEYEPVDAAMPDSGEPHAGEADAGAGDGDGGAPNLNPERRVVSAFLQTCAIRDGKLFCWGDNRQGQAGSEGAMYQPHPAQLAREVSDFVDVCTGAKHSCALRANGIALCWGNNERGQLGLGHYDPRSGPTEIKSYRFASISCGGSTSCGLSAEGDLFCWGEDSEGELGQGSPEPASAEVARNPAPQRVTDDLTFHQVSVGEGHVCAFASGAKLHCWGRNNYGQAGSREHVPHLRAPALVNLDDGWRVAAGQRHTCALDRAGRLYCWGDYLNRGLDDASLYVPTPTRFGSGSDYDDLAVNWFHSCVREPGGLLSCWGRNVEGQLGLGDDSDRLMPIEVEMAGWRSFAVGNFHTCGFRGDDLYCWGANQEGELGLGHYERTSSPRMVGFP